MLTVLLATHNGARLLPQVLEAYTHIQAPPGDWRLVVVDNASSDATRAIVTAFQPRLPLTCLYEGRLGKNQALTTGLAAATGDLIVFTDDDVFPRPDWLVRLRAAADAQPSCAIFGGVVLPRWEDPPPSWLLAWVLLGPVFTLTSPDTVEGPTAPHNIFGPNMAIRAAVFAAGHRFDTTIGPRGGSRYAMGSETELVRRLLRHGHTAWYVRDAVVEHFIRAHQMRERWILGRAVRYGRGQYRLASPPATRSVLGVPRYMFRDLIAYGVAMARGLFSGDRQQRFRASWDFSYTLGQALEARRMSRRAARGDGDMNARLEA